MKFASSVCNGVTVQSLCVDIEWLWHLATSCSCCRWPVTFSNTSHGRRWPRRRKQTCRARDSRRDRWSLRHTQYLQQTQSLVVYPLFQHCRRRSRASRRSLQLFASHRQRLPVLLLCGLSFAACRLLTRLDMMMMTPWQRLPRRTMSSPPPSLCARACGRPVAVGEFAQSPAARHNPSACRWRLWYFAERATAPPGRSKATKRSATA